MTVAEEKLWYYIRQRQLGGHRFRRQVPIGSYIVDFACLASRLAIEVDGTQHPEPDSEATDAERTRWLNAQGYRVLRFWNYEVMTEIDGVLDDIFNALSAQRSNPTSARTRADE
jgi:very-short-patch-repair endonuclease